VGTSSDVLFKIIGPHKRFERIETINRLVMNHIIDCAKPRRRVIIIIRVVAIVIEIMNVV